MKKLTAFCLFWLCFLIAKADTFIVTSNADSGPGSLREAISLANANGNAVTDFVHFNLPVSNRKINLSSELPAFTSNIVVDGTTQTGSKFGLSDAKVELYFNYSAGVSQMVFRIFNCTNIGIYGLKLTDNITWTQWYKETTCIQIENSSNIEIGNVGKGNVLVNWVHAIVGRAYPNSSNAPVYLKNLRIHSNFLGLLEDGETAVGDGDLIVISKVDSLQVGNLNPLSGNILAATRKRIAISGTKGLIMVANNKIGTNFLGTSMLSMPYGESNHLHDQIAILNSPYGYEIDYQTEIKVINNLITGTCGNGVKLQGYGRKFYIQGNKIGTDITGKVRLNQTMDFGINIENCRSGLIGVENNEEEKNTIAFSRLGSSGVGAAVSSAITVYNSPSGITISKNTTFCNQYASIYLPNGGAFVLPQVSINNITNTSISGKAPPYAKIELFKDDSCVNCEGKFFFDTTLADGAGRWSKLNINSDNVVVTATDTGGMTSEFSAAKFAFSNFRIKDATCGQMNGSITGINIVSGTWWQWENQAGVIISKDSVLKNVGPGSYRLTAGIGSNSCSVSTNYYEIRNIELPNSIQPVISAAACGKNNGAIRANFDNYSFTGFWLNTNKDSIGTGNFLTNAFPGTYFLKLAVSADTSCNRVFGPFIVSNQSGPSLTTSNLQIAPASCGSSTGSISGIAALNASGLVHITWVDSLNKVVGNSFNLLNIPPGKYRMKFKDGSSCDTIITPFYVVGNTGQITIDVSMKIVRPANCTGNTGSIQNITVIGGTDYEWRNLATGFVAGNSINISNLPAGNYQLTVKNSSGCTKLSPVINVPQTSFIPIGVSFMRTYLAFCDQPNGSLRPETFTGDTSLYSFRWVDSATNQTMGNYTQLYGIYAGTYLLFAKDSNGCEAMIRKTTIIAAPKPSFDYTGMMVKPDNCLSGQGSISGIVVHDLRNNIGTYAWFDNANDSIRNTVAAQNLISGTYVLKVTDIMGCQVTSRPILVENVNTSLANPLYDNQMIVKNTPAVLKIKNIRTGSYELYDDASATNLMQTNTTGNFTTPPLSADRTFYVRYVSGICSSDVVPVKITVVDQAGIYVPTAFTPNSDGKNDVLKVVAYGKYKLHYFSIFNRWGEAVFSSSDFSKGWNGTVLGLPATPGVYIWILKATDELTGKQIEQKGTVTIIR